MSCVHDGNHCSEVFNPYPYAVTRAVKHPTDDTMIAQFVRWSTPDDPEFPCLCNCGPCDDWRQTKAEIDGPVILPTE